MARKTKQEAELTRKNILDAAVTTFLDKGVARTTLNDIAKQAGYTRGALYHHFSNKSDIVIELLDSVLFPFEEMLEEQSLLTPDDPLRTLQTACESTMRLLFEDEQRKQIHTILFHRCEFVEELNPLYEKAIAYSIKNIQQAEKFFAAAQRAGQLRANITPSQASFLLQSYTIGIYWNSLRYPDADYSCLSMATTLDIFFCGIRA